MTAARGPTRLHELAAEAPELAAAIRGARAEQAGSARIESLARRLEPQLTGVAPTAVASAALGAWVKGVLGVCLLLGAGAYLATRDRGPQLEQRAAPPANEVRSDVTSAPTSGGVEPSPAAVVVEAPRSASPVASPSPHVRRARSQATPVVVSPPPPPSPEAELALLERARAELDRAPQATLELVDEHARSFERGVFAQEREVLAIEALLKLKHRDAARARAQAFVHTYPDSPHARRVRGLLEIMPAPRKDPR